MTSKTYRVSELAAMIEGSSIEGAADMELSGLNSLKMSTAQDFSFVKNEKYYSAMLQSKAGAFLVTSDFPHPVPEGKAFIRCENPDKSFTKLSFLFAPPEIKYDMSIHPQAFIHPSAHVAEGVHVGPGAVIDEGATVETGARICACAYVGPFCKIGENTLLYPNVSIMKHCIIGKRVIIHAGASIGADGFGYTPTFRGLVKVPQNGIVQIDDDVEIGANSTIDRSRFGKTWIKKGVKIDNLVHVAHNVIIGESSVLIGQCGIAGSVDIGRGVVISAQAGINGHISLGDGAKIAGATAVHKSIPQGQTAIGVPAETQEEFIERHMLPRKVKRLVSRIEKLEQMLAALKESH